MMLRRIGLLVVGGLALVGCGAGGSENVASQDSEWVEIAAAEAPSSEARRAPTTNPIDVSGSASLGPANAPVTLVEFSDFQ